MGFLHANAASYYESSGDARGSLSFHSTEFLSDDFPFSRLPRHIGPLQHGTEELSATARMTNVGLVRVAN